MQTWSGHAFDLLAPQPSQIFLCDIAISLERIPRFNAHTTIRTWSVAQHSLLVANLVAEVAIALDDEPDPSLRLAALLHDAHEAYTGDITAPLKRAFEQLTGRSIVNDIAEPIQAAIHQRFSLPEELPSAWRRAIHHADMLALAIESAAFMGPHPRPWVPLPPVPGDAGDYIEAVDLYFRAGFGFTTLVNNAMDTTAAQQAVQDG
jgi:hypothetical protein